jgi:DNA-binding XRE family transcriptional regulator
LPQLLRTYRERAQVTQEELAARTRLSVRALRNLESGRTSRPHRDTIHRLAAGLGLNEAELRALDAAVTDPGGEVPGRVGRPQWRGERSPLARATPAPPVATPNQLPPNIADFTGRDAMVNRLRSLLSDVGVDRPASVVVIDGKAGVGKTTLAVNLAHLLRDRFPDGQLFVRLGATGGRPLDPSEALARLLRALGIDAGALPNPLEERGNLFRSLVADRRLLMILDDAAREDQVRPLLPGGGSCAVLITSRVQLIGLEGPSLVPLDVLEPAEALELLTRIVGPERVRRELAAAREIVAKSGYLPLAVRIAGARLVARPHWRLAHLASVLLEEVRRLDEMVAGDLDIRARLEPSYQALGERERKAFRRLGLLEASDIADWVIAALLDSTLGQAERLADRLVSAHLLEIRVIANPPGQVRYRLHDLLRIYAQGKARDEEQPAERRAALTRAFSGWLTLAQDADLRLPHAGAPGVDLDGMVDVKHWRPPRSREWGVDDPLTWFEAERPMLIAVLQQASALGMAELACAVAAAASRFLKLRGYDDDLRAMLEEALAAARSAGHDQLQDAMSRQLERLRPREPARRPQPAVGPRAVPPRPRPDDFIGSGRGDAS